MTKATRKTWIFDSADEAALASYVGDVTARGYSCSRTDLFELVSETSSYLNLRKDVTFVVSDTWLQGYLDRWPALKLADGSSMNACDTDSKAVVIQRSDAEVQPPESASSDIQRVRYSGVYEAGYVDSHRGCDRLCTCHRHQLYECHRTRVASVCDLQRTSPLEGLIRGDCMHNVVRGRPSWHGMHNVRYRLGKRSSLPTIPEASFPVDRRVQRRQSGAPSLRWTPSFHQHARHRVGRETKHRLVPTPRSRLPKHARWCLHAPEARV